MKNRIICILTMCACLLLLVNVSPGQKILAPREFHPQTVVKEVTAKYLAFNTRLEDQTVELWDTYFLKSPNIGNMHIGRPEIGWQKVHEGSLRYVKGKPEGKMEMRDIKVYPIKSYIAWVDGTMYMETKTRIIEGQFFDSLVKTEEGWRVILSVVQPPKVTKKE